MYVKLCIFFHFLEQFIPQIKCPSITEKDDILFMEELQVLISRSLIIRHQLEMFDEDNR